MTPSRIVQLYGKPGAGKTHLAKQIAEQTGWHRLSIDDFGPAGTNRWPWLIQEVRRSEGTVIVESNVVPPQYRELLEASDYVAVEVVASDADRRARMRARDGQELRATRSPGIRADLRVRSGREGVSKVIELAESGATGWGPPSSESSGHRPRSLGLFFVRDGGSD